MRLRVKVASAPGTPDRVHGRARAKGGNDRIQVILNTENTYSGKELGLVLANHTAADIVVANAAAGAGHFRPGGQTPLTSPDGKANIQGPTGSSLPSQGVRHARQVMPSP